MLDYRNKKNKLKKLNLRNVKRKINKTINTNIYIQQPKTSIAQSAGAVEYTDNFSAEGYPPNECPEYETKQSDGEVPAMLELWGMWSTPLSYIPTHPLGQDMTQGQFLSGV